MNKYSFSYMNIKNVLNVVKDEYNYVILFKNRYLRFEFRVGIKNREME